MMMMPRAYGYSSGVRDRSLSPRGRRKLSSPTKAKHARQNKQPSHKQDKAEAEPEKKKSNKGDPQKPKRISSISHSKPSEPVIIPTRTSSSKKSQKPATKSSKKRSEDQHDSDALSPSVLALLAVTAEPRTTALAIKGADRARLMRESARKSVSSTSPLSWNILQSPPSPSDTENENDKDTDVEFDVGSLASQSTLADRLAMYRSLSSDSVPSLDVESDIFTSPDSPPMPRTPSSKRARSPRRDKSRLSSIVEPLADGELHPLSIQQSVDEEPLDDADNGSTLNPDQIGLDVSGAKSGSSKSSRFKSNLTASLQRLKSAAKSINIPSSSMSTVLAINSKYVVDGRQTEPRPKSPLPITNSAFSGETLSTIDKKGHSDLQLCSQLYFSSTPGEEYRPISSSVQLQEYIRRVPDEDPLLDRATAPPIFASSSPPPPIILPGVNSPRPREPRENSDFLRVVVLEMNMRRAGKLGDIPGRARIWIGPRPEKVKTSKDNTQTNEKEANSSTKTRAEKGMSEEVVTEIAEAMVERREQSDTQNRSGSNTTGGGNGKGGRSKGEIPQRWVAWVPE